ncbi:hypothetical protein [Plantibacter sp. YIM 135249]|uniref:hypothetical protein n=1 Tax=Plantibacter sp. YIM 135249 TaxID=3423918 RepID=UPI003D34E25C
MVDETGSGFSIVLRKHHVAFVYAERFAESGSTIMRGRQLSELARQHLGSRFSVDYVPLEASLRGRTLFLTKGAVKELSVARAEQLRAAGNRIYADVVDEELPPLLEGQPDAIVASSQTGFIDLARRHPESEVVLINHHVDPRVMALGIDAPTSQFRVGYFGETVNAVLSPRLAGRVDVVPVDTSTASTAWIAKLPGHALHYAVRNTRELDLHKPFLKGFTAAWCSANVLIQRSQSEAVHWLGEDYPYLLPADPREQDILAALDDAAAQFGGPVWADALARMAEIRDRTTPERIVLELKRALTS